jgi:hypothetical protein
MTALTSTLGECGSVTGLAPPALSGVDETADIVPADTAKLRGVVYIAGYGRSGSTLFSRILAENDSVIDLGQVVRAARHLGSRKRYCTCGQPVAGCPVWGRIPPVAGRSRDADGATHLCILETIAGATGYPVIVDSSKTALRHASRPFLLARNLRMPLTMIHLTRDPRGVLWSVLRERDRNQRPSPGWLQIALAFKISAAWTLANLAAELFGLWHRRAYVRVGYEDAMRRGVPAVLHGLIAPGPLTGRTITMRPKNQHSLGGNRGVRRAQSITVRADEDWRGALHPGLASLTKTLCLPLIIRYGFLRPPSGAAPSRP